MRSFAYCREQTGLRIYAWVLLDNHAIVAGKEHRKGQKQDETIASLQSVLAEQEREIKALQRRSRSRRRRCAR